jgi:hypothetical protein
MCEFELLKACLEEHHDRLASVGVRGHSGGMVHDHTAST